jgi:hypothetical protein
MEFLPKLAKGIGRDCREVIRLSASLEKPEALESSLKIVVAIAVAQVAATVVAVEVDTEVEIVVGTVAAVAARKIEVGR